MNVLKQIAVAVITIVRITKVVITARVILATDSWMMTRLVRVSIENVHLHDGFPVKDYTPDISTHGRCVKHLKTYITINMGFSVNNK